MRWSFTLAHFGGTKLRIHVTFFLLLVWIAAVSFPQGGWPGVADGVVFILLTFACVVLHEFGHVFAARRYGIRTPDITILPIGGVARLEKMPDKPVQELVVALAGPAVNVGIAAILIIALDARFDFNDLAQLQAAQTSLAGRLLAVNVILVLFNMIPALPLDGGRVLRALLAWRLQRHQATYLAARIGQAFAILFAVAGLFGNPLLLLVAVFIFFAAEAEQSQDNQRALASSYKASDAMITRYESLQPGSTAQEAADLLLQTTQQEFPVVSIDRSVVGMVTRKSLIETIQRVGPTVLVSEFMVREIPAVDDAASLDSVMEQLAQNPAHSVFVRAKNGGQIKGYISAENAAELFMLDKATKRFAAT